MGGVAGWLLDAFTHGLESGEVQNAHNGMPDFPVVFEDVTQPGGILNVDLVEGEFGIAAELAHAFDGFSFRVAQVVKQHRHEPGFVQGHGSVTSM